MKLELTEGDNVEDSDDTPKYKPHKLPLRSIFLKLVMGRVQMSIKKPIFSIFKMRTINIFFFLKSKLWEGGC